MLDLASKYVFVIGDVQSYFLLSLIEEYVNGAELQIRRIDRNRNSIRKSLESKCAFESTKLATHQRRQRRLFHDAHFYFICIGQVSKSLDRLGKRLGNPKLKKASARFNREFSREIRNDLEHIDARAVGKKKKRGREVDIGPVRGFKNFAGDKLTFDGKSYRVNKDSLNRLKSIYRKVIDIIHEDYALKDANFVATLIRDKQIAAMTKAAAKEYENYQRRSRT